jgi:hypothetical protein
VTTSYGEGLLQCYLVEKLPRTNNDLERCITGRKRASPALVVRGSVRVVAARASRIISLKWLNCVLPISRPGVHCVKRSIIAMRVVEINSASVAIHKPISPRWNSVSSDQQAVEKVLLKAHRLSFSTA